MDSSRDKTHNGEFWVKVMKVMGEARCRYIVARMNKDGRFCRRKDGRLDISFHQSARKMLVSVCEKDFTDIDNNYNGGGDAKVVEGNIHVVKSTTSSHYSVFRQRIPGYDLRYVRNYVQFKNRLDGMELYLDYIKRDIERKEIRCSECFIQHTFALEKLISEIVK